MKNPKINKSQTQKAQDSEKTKRPTRVPGGTRVALLAGSPNKAENKGNSDTLLGAFRKGIESVPGIEIVSKTYLYDLPMQDYCHTCKVPTQSETEFKEVAESLRDMDGVVLATPTYNFNVPAPVKNFIDRIGYVALDYRKMNRVGQPTGLLGHLRVQTIITGGTPNHLRRILFFLFPGFWLKFSTWYYGVTRYSSSYAGKLTYSTPAQDDAKLLKKYEKMGAKWAKKLVKETTKRRKR